MTRITAQFQSLGVTRTVTDGTHAANHDNGNMLHLDDDPGHITTDKEDKP